MSATDAGFLYLERPHALLHIGALAIVEGELGERDLAERIESRLPHLRRYAQRAMPVPLAAAHPTWEDDPDFDVREHIHRWALPAPGTEAQLSEICATLLAQPLERSRPLWEMHVLEGLEGGRTAVFQKVHHCMIDGVSGAQLIEQIFDRPAVEAAPRERLPLRRPPPAPATRLWRGVRSGLRRQLRTTATVLAALSQPERARVSVQRLIDAAGSALRLATQDVPALPWNAPLGRRRRLALTRLPMDGVRGIRAVHRGTVNDVVLSVLAGGLHRYLRGMGIETAGRELVALVPVSLRAPHESHSLGNRISAMIVPLAVDVPDEVSRLQATREITERLRANAAWSGIGALLDLLDSVPAPLVALAGRTARWGRIANVVATNVPGPREARSLCGRPLEALYPIVPIADGIGLGLAVFSYNGWLHVGLNAEANLVPDLEKLKLGIEESFAALVGNT